MCSKALINCFPFENTALVLLCEVALGNVKEMKQFDCDGGKRLQEEGFNSVLGCGFVFPDDKARESFDGVEIPLGKPVVGNYKVILFLN